MIKLENVSKYYHNQNVVALGLRKINLEFKIGEFVALTGESGSGKSTLLNVISGMDTYEEGEVYINGEETSYYDQSDWEEYRKNSVGFIFQNYNLVDSYTVLQNVEAALIIQNIPKKERIARAKEIIDQVGLTARIRHKATKLSGGEKQRLSIARALAKNTNLIVADEPTGNLDSKSGQMILELLHQIAKDKLVIIVTHNYQQTEPYVTRQVRLFDGEVVEDKEIVKIEEQEEEQQLTIVPEDTIRQHHKKALIFASYNILSQPKKSILMLLVTFATVFFVFAIYSGYLILSAELRGDSFNPFDEIQNHVYPERIIVTKPRDNDGNRVPMTLADKTFFLGLSEVRFLYEYDALFDATLQLSMLEDNNPIYVIQEYYLQNIETIQNQSLLAGRMPENNKEVVITSAFLENREAKRFGFEDWLKDEPININLNLKVFSGFANNNYSGYKVVGIIRNTESRFMYVEEEILDLFWDDVKDYRNLFSLSIVYDGKYSWEITKTTLQVDDRLVGNEIVLPYSMKWVELELNEDSLLKLGSQTVTIHPTIEQPQDQTNAILWVSQAFYDQHTTDDYFQYTLHVQDVSLVNATIRKLNEADYFAYNPATSNPPNEFNDFLLIPLITFGIFSFFVLFMIYLFSYLIIRTILMSKKRDYTILRTIGSNIKSIKSMSRYEIMISFATAFVLLLLLVFGLSFSNDEFIRLLLGVFTIFDYTTLFFVNIVISILIARRYNRKMVSQSVFTSLKAGE